MTKRQSEEFDQELDGLIQSLFKDLGLSSPLDTETKRLARKLWHIAILLKRLKEHVQS